MHYLVVENLGLLPAEVLVGEVAVLGCLEVDWLSQTKLLDDYAGSKVKVLADDLDELVGGAVGGAI